MSESMNRRDRLKILLSLGLVTILVIILYRSLALNYVGNQSLITANQESISRLVNNLYLLNGRNLSRISDLETQFANYQESQAAVITGLTESISQLAEQTAAAQAELQKNLEASIAAQQASAEELKASIAATQEQIAAAQTQMNGFIETQTQLNEEVLAGIEKVQQATQLGDSQLDVKLSERVTANTEATTQLEKSLTEKIDANVASISAVDTKVDTLTAENAAQITSNSEAINALATDIVRKTDENRGLISGVNVRVDELGAKHDASLADLDSKVVTITDGNKAVIQSVDEKLVQYQLKTDESLAGLNNNLYLLRSENEASHEALQKEFKELTLKNRRSITVLETNLNAYTSVNRLAIGGLDQKVTSLTSNNKNAIQKLQREVSPWLRNNIISIGVLDSQLLGVLKENQDNPEALSKQLNQFLDTFNFTSDEIPVGTICAFPRQNAPVGWLKCDGSPILASDYRALVSHLEGPDADQATLPDLRGVTLKGFNLGRADGDEIEVSLLRSNISTTDLDNNQVPIIWCVKF